MSYTTKPKFVTAAPPKGRSIVYYLGAHPFKNRSLSGTADYPIKADGERVYDKAEFIDGGMTAYDFERVDPDSKQRYAVVDLPQHLLYFAIHIDGEKTRPYKVKPTAAHRKSMELLQRLYLVDNASGELKLRKDVAQQESDLSAILE